MTPLRRHQLAYLSAAGWAALRTLDDTLQAQDCLAHWRTQRLPLVVARQPGALDAAGGRITLGLPAPLAWGRRRIGVQVPRSAICYFDEFPRAADVVRQLPRTAAPAWRRLAAALDEGGAPARVYGSHGWQRLTGLPYLRPGSDIDLWVAVRGARQADEAAAQLQRSAAQGLRLDGELVFGDGGAVQWREWAAWRAGEVRAVLVKRLAGAELVHDACRFEAEAEAAWA
ncbi:malonate decarboxylase holo-[acyl-carrier-protein] synthase [Aquincola sp. MAHUQ-54]|uniref:Malonate decarboxylase holo-[acyl-carrier-protein] synthase n=1 Tax=Aquincola agrisoli TaxID=3119538 RepID=A0AAW9QSA5_9BURK